MNSESHDENETSSLDTLVEHCQEEAGIQDIPADLQLASHVAASQPVGCGLVGFLSVVFFFLLKVLKNFCSSLSRKLQKRLQLWNFL